MGSIGRPTGENLWDAGNVPDLDLGGNSLLQRYKCI